VGTGLIAAREERLRRHVAHRWADSPGIEVLDSPTAARLAVICLLADPVRTIYCT